MITAERVARHRAKKAAGETSKRSPMMVERRARSLV